jgi:hypothetical protein
MKYILPIERESSAWYRMDEGYFAADHNYRVYILRKTSGKYYHDIMCDMDIFEFDNIDDFNFAKRLKERLEEPERAMRTLRIMCEDKENKYSDVLISI